METTFTTLVFAIFLGSFLNTFVWGMIGSCARLYIYYRDLPKRKAFLQEAEALDKIYRCARMDTRGPTLTGAARPN